MLHVLAYHWHGLWTEYHGLRITLHGACLDTQVEETWGRDFEAEEGEEEALWGGGSRMWESGTNGAQNQSSSRALQSSMRLLDSTATPELPQYWVVHCGASLTWGTQGATGIFPVCSVYHSRNLGCCGSPILQAVQNWTVGGGDKLSHQRILWHHQPLVF